jgi:hypothetical protein
VIPVIFKVTGQETLDVVTLPKGFNAKNINSTTGIIFELQVLICPNQRGQHLTNQRYIFPIESAK